MIKVSVFDNLLHAKKSKHLEAEYIEYGISQPFLLFAPLYAFMPYIITYLPFISAKLSLCRVYVIRRV